MQPFFLEGRNSKEGVPILQRCENNLWTTKYQLRFKCVKVKFWRRFSASRVAPKSRIPCFMRCSSYKLPLTWKNTKNLPVTGKKWSEVHFSEHLRSSTDVENALHEPGNVWPLTRVVPPYSSWRKKFSITLANAEVGRTSSRITWTKHDSSRTANLVQWRNAFNRAASEAAKTKRIDDYLCDEFLTTTSGSAAVFNTVISINIETLCWIERGGTSPWAYERNDPSFLPVDWTEWDGWRSTYAEICCSWERLPMQWGTLFSTPSNTPIRQMQSGCMLKAATDSLNAPDYDRSPYVLTR